MFKEDLSVDAGHRLGTPTAASVSSSPTSTVGTYQSEFCDMEAVSHMMSTTLYDMYSKVTEEG